MKLPNWLSKLSVRRVALVDQPANPAAEVVLFKAKNPPAPPPASDDGTCPSCKVPLGQDGKCPECGYMAKAPAGNLGPPEKLPKTPPGSDEHDAYKGVTMPDEKKEVTKEAVVELLEKAEVTELRKALEHEKAEKKLLVDRVEKIELARRNEVYIAKAKEFDFLPGATADDLGPILSKMDAALPDSERAKIWEILRSANQAIKHSALFGEVGREGIGLGSSDAEQALEKITKSLMEADPKMDHATAYTKACKDNPKLYEKYEADRRSARR